MSYLLAAILFAFWVVVLVLPQYSLLVWIASQPW